jgi:hypothetical protein
MDVVEAVPQLATPLLVMGWANRPWALSAITYEPWTIFADTVMTAAVIVVSVAPVVLT